MTILLTFENISQRQLAGSQVHRVRAQALELQYSWLLLYVPHDWLAHDTHGTLLLSRCVAVCCSVL